MNFEKNPSDARLDRPAPTDDRFNLGRFVEAQSTIYSRVLEELRAGRKQTHWMWFIFPQMAGLGHSATARRYAIRSLEEAQAYLQHGLLRRRLIECCMLLLASESCDAQAILGSPDDLKLRSSMTLFKQADASIDVFGRVLEKFFQSRIDQRTVDLLRAMP